MWGENVGVDLSYWMTVSPEKTCNLDLKIKRRQNTMSEMMGMGWLPDYPDFRDHSVMHDEVPPRLKLLGQEDSVKAMLQKVGVVGPPKALPPTADLRA